MRVLEVKESMERCAESGWFAYDIVLDNAVDDEFIKELKPLGSLLYMPMLKKPFFKVESDNYFLKGIKGDSFFRLAIHKDYIDELEKILFGISGLKYDKNIVE